MVMFIPERSRATARGSSWRRWLIGVAAVSFGAGSLLWLGGADGSAVAWGLAFPWLAAAGCLVISSIWGLITIPLMLWIARWKPRQ